MPDSVTTIHVPSPAERRRRSRIRRVLLVAAAVLITILVLLAGAVVWISTADIRPTVERIASDRLGRAVTMSSLRIRPGLRMGVEASELRLANAPWSSEPVMIRAGRITAEVDLLSLLTVPRLERVRIEDFALRLERGPERVGNWRLGSGAPADTTPLRGQVPLLKDFLLAGGRMVYRTSSGKELVVDAREWAISAAGMKAPIEVRYEGAYGGHAIGLQGTLESHAALHNVAKPVRMAFTARTDAGVLRFDGGSMRPLEFDEIAGALGGDIRDLGAFLGVFGAPATLPLPLKLDGSFVRNGDAWRVNDAKGRLGEMPLGGMAALTEGNAGRPDTIETSLDFERLDLNAILGKSGSGERVVKPDPTAPRVTGKITARDVVYREWRFGEAVLEASQTADKVTVERLEFGLWGGRVSMQATSEADPGDAGARIAMTMRANGLDVAVPAGLLGADRGTLGGRFALAASLTGTGATWDRVMRTARGEAALAMSGGRIATSILEKASVDIRSLFRRNASVTAVQCLLAAARIREGVAAILPLRLRTNGPDIEGGGTVDFIGGRLDLTVGSERASSGTFALDIPLRFSGPFNGIDISPAEDVARGIAGGGRFGTGALPGIVGDLVQGNRCNRPL